MKYNAGTLRFLLIEDIVFGTGCGRDSDIAAQVAVFQNDVFGIRKTKPDACLVYIDVFKADVVDGLDGGALQYERSG